MERQLVDSRKPRLRGRKIVRIEWNEFDNGRGEKVTDPIFHLDDGSLVSFSVAETEVGEYGINVNWHRPNKVEATSSKDRRS